MTVQFPSYSDIVGDTGVLNGMNAAWQSTLAAASSTGRREECFWILLNTKTEKYEIGSTTLGPTVTDLQTASVTPDAKPADQPLDGGTAMKYTVALFHTHTPTFYRSVGRLVGPSGADKSFMSSNDVVGIVYDYVGDSSGNAPAGWALNSSAKLYDVAPARRSTPN